MGAHKPRPKVLISGLGIAGATLAWWLDRRGFAVTVVERAPEPRTGGYMIDFWGPGYTVADRMGLLKRLRSDGYLIEEIKLVKWGGRPFATIAARSLREALNMQFISVLRDDLTKAIYGKLRDSIDVRFDDQIRFLTDNDDKVEVGFAKGRPRAYDLVIGADGLNSGVREAVLDEPAVKPLGYWAASFSTEGYPHRDFGGYVTYTEVGRQVARYALRGDRTAFLFVFRPPATQHGVPPALDQRAILRQQYAGGWEGPDILKHLDKASSIYFNEVSQVCAPYWSKGRIALVGDAAYCPSLLAGQGASLAMTGAYILAGELGRAGGAHALAFLRYEQAMRPLVARAQRSALRMGGWFAPKSRAGLITRNVLSRLAAIPPITRRVVGAVARETVKLESYPDYTLKRGAPTAERWLQGRARPAIR
jgi:2-polyprenyl-6-methoxyphenol hydroxylase-like FAD-dependent oxidoreductase